MSLYIQSLSFKNTWCVHLGSITKLQEEHHHAWPPVDGNPELENDKATSSDRWNPPWWCPSATNSCLHTAAMPTPKWDASFVKYEKLPLVPKHSTLKQGLTGRDMCSILHTVQGNWTLQWGGGGGAYDYWRSGNNAVNDCGYKRFSRAVMLVFFRHLADVLKVSNYIRIHWLTASCIRKLGPVRIWPFTINARRLQRQTPCWSGCCCCGIHHHFSLTFNPLQTGRACL